VLLRNLSKFIQIQSISKSRFSGINTNSDITPPNNLDMVTHTWAPDTSPKVKSLQDLSIKGNPKVTKEVVHLRLHVCKVIHPSLDSSDPFNRALSLVNPITDVLLQRSVPARVTGRDKGSGSEARLRVIVRGIVTTTPMVTRVAIPIPSVPLGLLWVSLRCSRGLLCYLHTNSPTSVRWSYEAVAHLSHPIKLQCKSFTRVQSKAQVR
jgi:hypothetical protein